MMPALQKPFAALEHFRTDLLNTVNGLPASQLSFKPAPEAWSVLEVIEHLILVEKATLSYLQQKVSAAATLAPLGWESQWRCFLLICAMRSPLKFKTPTPLVLPASGRSLRELQNEWQALRQQWRATLSALTPAMLRLPLIRHPAAGRLTAAQGLRFIKAHFQHHLKQMARIQQAGRNKS